ncbi:hypothetical protein [Serratia sp. 2723]
MGLEFTITDRMNWSGPSSEKVNGRLPLGLSATEKALRDPDGNAIEITA